MPTVRKVRRGKRKSSSSTSTNLSLPTRDNVPPDELSAAVICIFGRKSIGKTTIANKFNDPLTFMFERSRRNLKIRQVPEYKSTDKKRKSLNWSDFLEYVELFLESKHQTAVIDTIDQRYVACMDHVCRIQGVSQPNGPDAWLAIAAEFNAPLNLIQDSGKGLIFLSHEVVKPITKIVKSLRRETDEDEMEMGRWEPSCKPEPFRTIKQICDYVLYYSFQENKRCMICRSTSEIAWCACGFEDHFLDPNGNQLEKFELGNTPDTAYQSLLDAYNNQLYDLDYEPPRRIKKKKRRKRLQ